MKTTTLAIVAAALVSIGTGVRGAVLSDGSFSVDVESDGYFNGSTLNGIPIDYSAGAIRGSCAGFDDGSPVVVDGTTATFTAKCGSFDVASTVRLLGPLASLPASSGGFEHEIIYTNNTGAMLPLEAIRLHDHDLEQMIGGESSAYDAASQAAYGVKTNVDPDAFVATIAATSFPDATFGWDVGFTPGLASTHFPMDNAVGPVGPNDTEYSIGFAMDVPPGESATVIFRVMYARNTSTVPADFDFSGCYSTPKSGCRTGEKSLLAMKDNSDDSKDKLRWKLIKGEATSQAEFGDPTAEGDYSLCVYDGSGQRIAGARVSASASKWGKFSDKGYKYKDDLAESSGIRTVQLKGSAQAKTKILVKGVGANLPDPALGSIATPITVQMHNGGNPGSCWGATYTSTIKNDAGQLKAKMP